MSSIFKVPFIEFIGPCVVAFCLLVIHLLAWAMASSDVYLNHIYTEACGKDLFIPIVFVLPSCVVAGVSVGAKGIGNEYIPAVVFSSILPVLSASISSQIPGSEHNVWVRSISEGHSGEIFRTIIFSFFVTVFVAIARASRDNEETV